MTSFSSRVLKSYAVKLDTENKVVIDVSAFHVDDEPPMIAIAEPTGPDAEEKAQSVAARLIFQAEQQAAGILSSARIKAATEQDMIINAAKDDAEKIHSEARDSGYKEGMDVAIAEGDAIVAESTRVLEEAKSRRKQMEESLEPDMVGLIIGICDKLIGETAEIKPEIVLNLIRQGLTSTTVTGEVKVFVSAADYDLVVSRKDELLALTDGSVSLDIVKDLSLNPMDSIISTPIGDVDVSLNQQYEALKANINHILSNSEAH